MNDFELKNWLPMEPSLGPPLPKFLNIFWPWYKPPLPEPPAEGIVVGLLNPPSGATMWNLTLTDWDVITLIDFVGKNGKERLDIVEAAVFITPDKWRPEYDFPMRIAELSIKKWKDDVVGGTIQQLYYIQSYRPYLWDWDKGGYGDDPDPTYREVFIPDYGSYYYNVSKERFEKA